MTNMNRDREEPRETMLLDSPSAIKAYVHPVRMTIVSLLAETKRTESDVARLLGVHPANLTRHFRSLEKAGLIRLVEKRDTGRNLEKYYRAAAHTFEVESNSRNPAGRAALALGILRNNLSAAMRIATDDKADAVLALLATARISASKIAQFQKKLGRLIEEFQASDSNGEKAFSLAAALYPEVSAKGIPHGQRVHL
jgi:DNA-binding transcriptional ArsR family regulator